MIVFFVLSLFLVLSGADTFSKLFVRHEIRDTNFCDFGTVSVDGSVVFPMLLCATRCLSLLDQDPCAAWIQNTADMSNITCLCGKAACVDTNRVNVDPGLLHNAMVSEKCHILDLGKTSSHFGNLMSHKYLRFYSFQIEQAS